MLSVQERLAQKIPGFKFNLGFSGRSFRHGNNEEDGGDNAFIEYAHNFTWFGHLYDHEQPHKHSYSEIVRSLTKNEGFAKVFKPKSLFAILSKSKSKKISKFHFVKC